MGSATIGLCSLGPSHDGTPTCADLNGHCLPYNAHLPSLPTPVGLFSLASLHHSSSYSLPSLPHLLFSLSTVTYGSISTAHLNCIMHLPLHGSISTPHLNCIMHTSPIGYLWPLLVQSTTELHVPLITMDGGTLSGLRRGWA